MQIKIKQVNISNWKEGTTDITLRFRASKNFKPLNESFVFDLTEKSYKITFITALDSDGYSSTSALVPEVSLPTTTDAIDSNDALWIGEFYEGDQPIADFPVSDFRLSPDLQKDGLGKVSWETVLTYNNEKVYSYGYSSYTKDELAALIKGLKDTQHSKDFQQDSVLTSLTTQLNLLSQKVTPDGLFIRSVNTSSFIDFAATVQSEILIKSRLILINSITSNRDSTIRLYSGSSTIEENLILERNLLLGQKSVIAVPIISAIGNGKSIYAKVTNLGVTGVVDVNLEYVEMVSNDLFVESIYTSLIANSLATVQAEILVKSKMLLISSIISSKDAVIRIYSGSPITEGNLVLERNLLAGQKSIIAAPVICSTSDGKSIYAAVTNLGAAGAIDINLEYARMIPEDITPIVKTSTSTGVIVG